MIIASALLDEMIDSRLRAAGVDPSRVDDKRVVQLRPMIGGMVARWAALDVPHAERADDSHEKRRLRLDGASAEVIHLTREAAKRGVKGHGSRSSRRARKKAVKPLVQWSEFS